MRELEACEEGSLGIVPSLDYRGRAMSMMEYVYVSAIDILSFFSMCVSIPAETG